MFGSLLDGDIGVFDSDKLDGDIGVLLRFCSLLDEFVSSKGS